MYNANQIDDQLWRLQKACDQYQDRLAKLVLFAVADYINTDKAPRQFVVDFIAFSENKFEYLIQTCLKGDRSANGIIQTCKRVFRNGG